MSLMGTLAKVAIGIAVAKGVGSMIQKAGAGSSGGAGSGGPFGGPNSPGAGGGAGGGLGDMLGEVLSGRTAPRGTTTQSPAPGGSVLGGSDGGIGGFLEELGGKGRAGAGGSSGGISGGSSGGVSGGGGIDDILGQLGAGAGGGGQGGSLGDLLGGLLGGQAGTAQGGAGGQGGGLGDLLGGLLGGLAGASAGGSAGGSGGSFGEVLNQSLGNRGEPDVAPTRAQDAAAALMLRAMIQAAKSDGKIDAEEKKKLLGNLGDISAAEKRFVEAELAAPVDVEGLARQVPRGLEAQVYTMSVMGIDLDNRNEAEYLHRFAGALGLDRNAVNHIHTRLGVPTLYS